MENVKVIKVFDLRFPKEKEFITQDDIIERLSLSCLMHCHCGMLMHENEGIWEITDEKVLESIYDACEVDPEVHTINKYALVMHVQVETGNYENYVVVFISDKNAFFKGSILVVTFSEYFKEFSTDTGKKLVTVKRSRYQNGD